VEVPRTRPDYSHKKRGVKEEYGGLGYGHLDLPLRYLIRESLQVFQHRSDPSETRQYSKKKRPLVKPWGKETFHRQSSCKDSFCTPLEKKNLFS